MMQLIVAPQLPFTIHKVWNNTGCTICAVNCTAAGKELEFFLEKFVEQIAHDFDIPEEELKEKGYL